MQVKSKSGRVFRLPSDNDDAAIRAGIAVDPDTHELTSKEFKQLRPMGRPRIACPKVPLTMRVDVDVLLALRASGQGWQTRVNTLLREAVTSGKV
ncbi:MAG: BrnA antitoxin family protein [Betaproteobacteria bacterium]|nr:BrnA antitoxin family protein [Betaproteobacteria bacterium]OIP14133.1 MAG: hypothetical protein AUK50_12405 [Comamonadaceae bacterium CG2_30_57_122]